MLEITDALFIENVRDIVDYVYNEEATCYTLQEAIHYHSIFMTMGNSVLFRQKIMYCLSRVGINRWKTFETVNSILYIDFAYDYRYIPLSKLTKL